ADTSPEVEIDLSLITSDCMPLSIPAGTTQPARNTDEVTIQSCGGGGGGGVPTPTPPAVPATPTGTISSNSITVRWNAVSGATSYRVQQRVNSGSWQTEINTGTAVSRAFSSLAAGNYQYRVRACNNSACSAYSAISSGLSILAVPAAPRVPTATLTSTTSINVSWGAVAPPIDPCHMTGTCHCNEYAPCMPLSEPAPVTMQLKEDTGLVTTQSSVSNYYVQQRLGSGNWQTAVNRGTATSHSYTGLAAGSYTYRVQSCNSSGCSSWTAASAAITIVAIPAVPAKPAVSLSGNTVTTSWGAVSGVSYYQVRQRLGSGNWQTAISTGTATSRAFSGLAAGTYQYQVRACNVNGYCSDWSAISNGITVLATPSAPFTPQATVNGNNNEITVDWTIDRTPPPPPIEPCYITGTCHCNEFEYCIPLGGPAPETMRLEEPSALNAIVDTAAMVSVQSTGTVTYRVQQRVNNGSWQAEVDTGTAKSKIFPPQVTGSYQYRVRACNVNNQCSAYSNVSNTAVILAVPAVPRTPEALVASVNSISVRWGDITPPIDPCEMYGACCEPGRECTIPLTVGEGTVLAAAPMSSGSFSYRVRQRVNGGAWQTDISTGTAISRTFSALATGSYQYQVRACNANNQCSAYSAVSNSVTIAAVPAIPARPAVSLNGNTVTASWNAVSGATSYRIQQRFNNGSWQTLINTGTATSRAFSGLSAGNYQYQVRACNVNGYCSDWSAVSSTVSVLPAPASPRVPTAYTSGVGNIVVSWAPNIPIDPCEAYGDCCDRMGHCNEIKSIGEKEDVTSAEIQSTGSVTYQVQQRLGSGNWQTAVSTGTAMSWTYRDLAAGSYSYRARACNSHGFCSAYTGVSNSITITKVAVPVASPAGGSHSGKATVQLSTATADAVIRYTLNNSAVTAGSAVYNGALEFITDTTLRARAYKNGMLDSDELVLQYSIIPFAPAAPAVTLSGTNIHVTWNEVTNAVSYQIQQKTGTSNWGTAQQSNNGAAHLFESVALGEYQFRVRACNSAGSCSAWSAASGMSFTGQLPAASVDAVPAAYVQAAVTDSTVVSDSSGSFRVDESGSAVYSLPLKLPAGIAGNTPGISINYNSQAGNGPLGKGWSIGGLSGIERCRQTPLQDGSFKAVTLTAEDRFCLDGQRLVVINGSYGFPGSVYATEIDSQLRVTALGNIADGPEYFEVRRADGSVSYYGKNTDSRMTTAAGAVISWNLSEITDRLGNSANRIVYRYTSVGNEVLLSSVSYSGNQVSFSYLQSLREDRAIAYVFDKVITPSALLQNVDVRNHQNALVYSAVLDYSNAPLSGVKRLVSITECGTGNSCLKPIRFDWHNAREDAPGIQTATTATTSLVKNDQIMFSQAADINGNGLPDLIYASRKGDNFYIKVLPNTGSGFSAPVDLYSYVLTKQNGSYPFELKLADLNGDGITDLLVYTGATTKQWQAVELRENLTRNRIYTLSSQRAMALHDFSGNGLMDILSSGMQLHENQQGSFTAPKTVQFSGIDLNCLQVGCEFNQADLSSAQAYDINGDGLNDLLIKMTESYLGDCDDYMMPLSMPQASALSGETVSEGSAVSRAGCQSNYNRYWGIFETQRTDNGNVRLIYKTALGGRYSTTNHVTALQVTDLNGDGLADFLYYDTNMKRWVINYNSHNRLLAASSTLHSSIPAGPDVHFMQVVDITGNGINDIVYYHNGWKYISYPYLGAPKVLPGPSVNTKNESAQFADMRGQGLPELLVTNYSDGKVRWYGFGKTTTLPCEPYCEPPPCIEPGHCMIPFSVTTASAAGNTAGSQHVTRVAAHQDRLWKVSSGHGLTTSIRYNFLINGNSLYERGQLPASNSDYPIFRISGAIPVVAEVVSDTGQGQVGVGYRYEGARIQAGGRGFLGFSSLTTEDSQTGITTTTRYLQSYPYIGMPAVTEQYYNGQLLSRAQNSYASIALNNGLTVYPYLRQADEEQYRAGYSSNGYSAPVKVSSNRIIHTYEDTEGSGRYVNLTKLEVRTRDELQGVMRRVLTENRYDADNAAQWSLARLTYSKVTHQQGTGSVSGTFTPDNQLTRIRSAAFSYYPNGLLKEEITEPDGDAMHYLSTQYTYDALGNTTTATVKSRQDTQGLFSINRSSETLYDSAGRYITGRRQNGKTIASYSSFTALGQPQTVTENGITTQLRYNAFGQEVFRREGSSTVSGKYAIITRGYTAAAVALPGVGVNGYSYQRVQQGGLPTVWTVADVAGRELATITEAFEPGQYVIRMTEYDLMGRAVRVSKPGFAAAALRWSESHYDIFDRPYLLTAADGTQTKISYQGLTTTSTISNYWSGAAAQTRTEQQDAFGQLSKVTDASGSISYRYDATGNLLQVTGPDGLAISMTYAASGRKTGMNDPNMGIWSYQYNALGELVSQTNSRQHTTETWYDHFGRKVQESIRDSNGPLRDTQWGYSDQIGHPVHNLLTSEVVSDGAARYFDYDSFGRLTRSELQVDDQILIERLTYDEYSRLFQQFDASGNQFGVQYQYRNGYQSALWEARYGTGNANSVRYQQLISMDAYGNVTESKAGNNRTSWRSYDAVTGMLSSITTQGGLQAWDYKFDSLGNLRSRSSLNQKILNHSGQAESLNERFEYDRLNRLEEVRNNGAITQQLSYFANGNIKTKSDVEGGSQYYYGEQPSQCARASGPMAVSRVGQQQYCYDSMGNQTHQYSNGALSRQIDYNALGKPSRIRSYGSDALSGRSEGESRFEYDGNRQVVRRYSVEQGSTKTIYHAGNVELIKEGEVVTIRRSVGNALVELSGQSSKTQYVYTDHLGSVDVITDVAGRVEQRLGFDAFGKRRLVMGPEHQVSSLNLSAILALTHRGFTGHQQVDHANIIHMGGRIYDAHIGRFLQADPFVQAPGNSQSLNRYSYVLNNPLSYTDPSGYFFSKLWKAVKPIIGVVVVAVVSIYCQACGTYFAGSWYGAATAGAMAGGINAAANGGNILKGALTGAFSAAAFYGVGSYFNDVSFGSAAYYGKVAAHGLVGGVMSVLQGGKFGHGFAAAGVTQAFAGKIDGINEGDRFSAGRITAAAVVGGTASKLSGGKFANGAVTGAFSRMFNDEMHREKELGVGYPFGKESSETLESLYPDFLSELENELNRIQINYIRGKTAESLAADFYRSEYGAFVLEGGITLSVDGSLRYPDLTIQYPDGRWEFVEVKSGNARLIKQQIRLDRIIQS
ncbi:RHS repeat-associated core domain-containing protein, partial [Chromatiaceae bacterium AAb-1]|nr:RHS repeat-associated core domain-containing protein [Chromatiaceae bacterium AAb-1]